MRIPWWGKVAGKLILSRLPFGYSVWQRLGMFRHGSMDNSAYAVRVFHEHLRRAALPANALAGKTIVELGPGDSVATAVIAASYGARSILVDVGRFVRQDLAPYRDLAQHLRDEVGLRQTPALDGVSSIEDLLAVCGAQYHTSGLTALRAVPTACADLIFSQAVLEHVRRAEFMDTMGECRRILKPGGVASHEIDLRDHLGGALNNLRFSESLWESTFFSNAGFYTNRLQFGAMTSVMQQAGFEVDAEVLHRWKVLPTPQHSFAFPFRQMTPDELSVATFHVILRPS